MKKSLKILVLALLSILMLNCAFAESGTQRDPMAVPTQASNGLPEGYDPASEEDNGSYASGAAYNDYGQAIYAGATPIPLDPIDMPTPTPKPVLTFSYGIVAADKLRLNFEAPA